MRRSIFTAFLSAAVVSMLALPAFAAEEKDKDDDIGNETSVTEGSAKPSAKMEKKSQTPFPRVADDEETIYAVQRKAYLVNRRLELTLMFSAAFTDRFVNSIGPAGGVTYHIAENFGVSAFGVFMFPDASALTGELLGKLRLTPEVAKLTQMLWGAGVGFEWSPIYGKVEIFGAYLGNFNFFVDVGGGLGQTRVPCTRGFDLDPNVHGVGTKCPDKAADAFVVVYEPNRLQLMAAFGGGVRFYFTNHIGLKLEFKDWLFPARVFRPGTTELTQRYTDAIRNNIFVQIGATYIFGGED